MTDPANNSEEYWYIRVPKTRASEPQFHVFEQIGFSWEDADGNHYYQNLLEAESHLAFSRWMKAIYGLDARVSPNSYETGYNFIGGKSSVKPDIRVQGLPNIRANPDD